MEFSTHLLNIALKAEEDLTGQYREIDLMACKNTEKVLEAFSEFKVSKACLDSSDGYGYDDRGRDTLDRIYAKVFNAEAAFVRHNIISGTHALTIALFALLRPGDILLSITGKPYDTLDEVIGIKGADGSGSLRDFGVEYRSVELGEDFVPELKDKRVKVVFIQRSKGYMNRRTLSVAEINEMVKTVKKHSDAYVIVDNCYGEFVDSEEPKADLIVGSLIKNPGGGMAESGGYIAGTQRAVELASYRWSCPGIGLEAGPTLGQNKNLYKGLFYAPHTVAQSLKIALFAAAVFEKLGYTVEPKPDEMRHDIIQTVVLNDPKKVVNFCKGIQAGAPIDSFVTPEPWEMPGYSDKVIMAAGAFTQGASIELSADAPMRPPYTVFFQGGLTYESGRYGILMAAKYLTE